MELSEMRCAHDTNLSNSLATFGLIILLALGEYSACAAEDVPPRLLHEIERRFPGDSILKAENLDVDCDPVPSPGFVEADFNGDGINDYAVLLIKFGRLVVFLGKANDAFEVTEIGSGIVSGDGAIELYPDPIIRERETGRIIQRLRYPGISFYNCGKSGWTFYWENGKFRVVNTSD